MTLINPSSKIMNLIPRFWARPYFDRVFLAKGMAKFEVSRP
jgi:hypothetical protein